MSGLVFYFSYHEQKENELLFQTQFRKNQHKLLADIDEYIKSIDTYFLCEKNSDAFNKLFKRILTLDLYKIRDVDANSALYQILLLLKDEYELHQCIPNNKNILKNIAYKVAQQSVPASKKMIPALFTFVGTFGSIAGCCAGVSGLLTGIGICSSFIAFPLVGCGVLLFALLSSVALAYEAFTVSIDDFKKLQLNLMMKNMHQQLSKAIMERNFNATLYKASVFLTEHNEGGMEVAPINQQIFACPYFKNLETDKRRLSFFNVNQPVPVTVNASLKAFSLESITPLFK